MRREDIKAVLAEWERKLLAATVNVMELQADDTHKILATAEGLKGRTLEVVKPAFEQAKCLWEGFDLIQRQLDKAESKYNEIKDSWWPSSTTLGEIDALLNGETVDLPAVLVPLKDRELTGGKNKAATTSLKKLLEQLVAAFKAKLEAVSTVSTALTGLNERLTAHDALLKEVKLQAEYLGGATLTEYRKCDEAYKGYRADVFTDPVGLSETLAERTVYLNNVKLRYTAAKSGKPLPPETPVAAPKPPRKPSPTTTTATPPPKPSPPVVTPPPPVPIQPPRDSKLDDLINGPGGDTPAPATDTPVDPALADLISKPGKPAEPEADNRPDPRIEHVLTSPTPKPSNDLEAVLNGTDIPRVKKDEKVSGGEAKPASPPASDKALDQVVNKPVKPASDPLADLVEGGEGQHKPAPVAKPEPKSERETEADRLAEVLEAKGKPDTRSTAAPKAKPQDTKPGGSVTDLIEGKPKGTEATKDSPKNKPLEDLF